MLLTWWIFLFQDLVPCLNTWILSLSASAGVLRCPPVIFPVTMNLRSFYHHDSHHYWPTAPLLGLILFISTNFTVTRGGEPEPWASTWLHEDERGQLKLKPRLFLYLEDWSNNSVMSNICCCSEKMMRKKAAIHLPLSCLRNIFPRFHLSTRQVPRFWPQI